MTDSSPSNAQPPAADSNSAAENDTAAQESPPMAEEKGAPAGDESAEGDIQSASAGEEESSQDPPQAESVADAAEQARADAASDEEPAAEALEGSSGEPIATAEEAEKEAQGEAEEAATNGDEGAKPADDGKEEKGPAISVPERPEVTALRQAMEESTPVEGKVIGWNNGGFHVVVGGITAFCPRSEMEIGRSRAPKSYMDQSYDFKVIKVQRRGRRVVLSRAAQMSESRAERKAELLKNLEVGAVVEGKVATITDFGAFVDLGGIQGLVHLSEMAHRRVEKADEIVKVGDKIKVKILRIESGGKRVSLSIRALEPNPWQDILDRYPSGTVVQGKVERTASFGAFIELEPGITGLLPTSNMALPRESTPERTYPPGKEVAVQVLSIDSRRRRISLGLEGSKTEGSRADYQDFKKRQQNGGGKGFNALAAAFSKLEDKTD